MRVLTGMTIQPEGFFIENLNPSSVVNVENLDLTKLPMGILGTSLILDIDDAKQNCVLTEGKYKKTGLTMKTKDLKSFVLRSM